MLTAIALVFAFGGSHWGLKLTPSSQLGLIVLGGFVATCTVGPAAAVVIGVIHPGVRSTGAAVLSLFQNRFGLAAGPFIAGALSDTMRLEMALTLTRWAASSLRCRSSPRATPMRTNTWGKRWSPTYCGGYGGYRVAPAW